MPTVQSLGMSGLPLDTLLTSLQNNENIALQAIQKRQVTAQNKLSAYGRLQDALAAFQQTASALSKTDSFGAITASVGSDALTATATTAAIPGQYSVRIDRLATAQTLAYDGRAERSAAIGTGGLITLTTADGVQHTLDLADHVTSLDGLTKAINADPDMGVNATIINDGGASPYRLLLTSRATGVPAAISQISVTGNGELDTFLGTTITEGDQSTNTGARVEAAQDAQITVNGNIAISSHTNTVQNVLDGVTLTLMHTTADPVTLSLRRDDGAARKAIAGFVSSYNGLLSTIRSLTAYDAAQQASAAPLTGDSLARSVQTRMQGALRSTLGATGGTTLSAIGITTDPKTGQLQVDQARLDQALANDLGAVKDLFTGTNGVGGQVGAMADAFTRSGGIFSATMGGLDRSIADMQKQFDATRDLINQRMDTYRTQFTRLDALVTQMNSLSSYLTQQLSALNGINDKSR